MSRSTSPTVEPVKPEVGSSPSSTTIEANNAGLLRARGRVAALSRSRQTDDPEMVAARRNLAAEQLAAYIVRVVDAAPPLTAEQRAELAVLLRGGDHR